MANNCLRTELKSSVENNSLEKLGYVKFKCNGTQGLTFALVSNRGNIEIKADGGTITVNSEVVNNPYILPLNTYKTIKISGDCYVYVSKYVFQESTITINDGFVDIKSLNGMLSPTVFDIRTPDVSKRNMISGNIAAIKDVTSLTGISFSYSDVYGDIESFEKLTNLTRISIHHTTNRVYGDVVNLIRKQYRNGRTSGSIILGDMYNSSYTFNGKTGAQHYLQIVNPSVVWNESTNKIQLKANQEIVDEVDLVV